jgi:hypothetical protein
MANVPPTNGLDSLKDSVANALGSALKGKTTVEPLPWQTSLVDSKFFKYITIKPERWDELYPYRILVIDTKKGNAIVGGSKGSKASVKKNTSNNSIVSFESLGSQWVFTLPISPQQLNITDQFAINTSATTRGIIEEHSGVRFKLINATGTMGVWPYRQSIVAPPGSPGILQSIFGGTIEAASNLLGQVNRVINVATSGHAASKPIKKRPETSGEGPTSTGYYQAMALQQFLEQYAEAKKDPKNAGWRLVFDIPKQNQSYVVTPMMFTWQQSATKPLEIMYQFQLKAWRRVDLKQSVPAVKPSIQTVKPGLLQRVLNTITEARKTMSAAVDLIGAVRSDVTAPLEVLRQTALFVKDLVGVAVAVADLPFQIQKDFASSIKESLNILSGSISTTSSNSSVRSSLSAIVDSSSKSEGLSLSAVSSGQLGNKASQAQSIDPANNVFSEPERNFELMNEVSLFSMNLNPAQQALVDEVIEEARTITVDDLKSFRAVIQDLALQLSNNFGAGDSFYSQIYNRPTPNTRIQPMTLDEYDILRTLYDTMQSYDLLTATTEIDDNQKQTNMEYVAGLADLAGIPFQLPSSKILVPVPFGLTIEGIATRYLGSPERWLEIATLNNLRAPYIDENGFKLPLLSNATGRQITVASTENLYVGQRVILASISQNMVARRILDIDRLSDVSFLITLDGEPNLDDFLLSDAAYLLAYLPGTVNSQQKIFIPSTIELPDDPNIVPPSSTSSDPLVGLSKVDWLLTDKGDVAVNSYGDFRLSAGITNLIQALKIKFGTVKGSMLTHTEFGFGAKAGIINADLNAQDLFDDINKMIIDDPRYQGLAFLEIEIDGPTMSINVGVNLAGQEGVLPLTFQVQA